MVELRRDAGHFWFHHPHFDHLLLHHQNHPGAENPGSGAVQRREDGAESHHPDTGRAAGLPHLLGAVPHSHRRGPAPKDWIPEVVLPVGRPGNLQPDLHLPRPLQQRPQPFTVCHCGEELQEKSSGTLQAVEH